MSQPTTRPLPIGFELQEYRIERLLGHGGFGVTYLARDRHLNAQVAIKEYLPRDTATRTRRGEVKPNDPKLAEDYAWGLDRFKREARALARFKHPNIVRVARLLEANGTAYMVMDFERGLTLSEYLRQHNDRLTEAELLGVFLPILDGLAALHAVDLIHRDIKPGNIYLRQVGPMLLDFGSARQLVAEGEDRELTALVTPGYAPLEQYSNDERQGPWSDLYSTGAAMYLCLFGAVPAQATARAAALAEGLTDPYEPAAVRGAGLFSPGVLEAIDWALALRMRDRPQSAAALRERLAAAGVAPVTMRLPEVAAQDEPTLKVELTGGTGTLLLPPPPAAGWLPWWLRDRRAQAALAIGAVAALTAFAVQQVLAQRADDRAFDAAQATGTPAAYARYLMECDRCAHRAVAETARDALNATLRRKAEEAEAAARAERERLEQEAAAAALAAASKPAPAPARPARRLPAAGTLFRDALGEHGLGPELVVVRGGAFQMGDATGNGDPDERPLHRVEVGAIAMGVHEVTRAEFEAFVEATGHRTTAQLGGGCRVTDLGRGAFDRWSYWKRAPFSQTDRSPVLCVSWHDARAYAAWLSKLTKRRYRLPTEAEWEHAARAGSARDWWWGDEPAAGKANCDGCGTGARPRTVEVGSFAANPWGLHDIAGNLAEWTCSNHGPRYDGGETVCASADSLRDRVVRGGSWAQRPEQARSANRAGAPADLAADSIGFRVVVEL